MICTCSYKILQAIPGYFFNFLENQPNWLRPALCNMDDTELGTEKKCTLDFYSLEVEMQRELKYYKL